MTREPEWDDVERDKRLAWDEYQGGICECGLHRTLADEDPDLELVPRVCPVCAGVTQAMRITNDADEKAMKRHGEHPPPDLPRPDDGRHFSLRAKPTTGGEDE